MYSRARTDLYLIKVSVRASCSACFSPRPWHSVVVISHEGRRNRRTRNMSQFLMQTDLLLSLARAEIAVCPFTAHAWQSGSYFLTCWQVQRFRRHAQQNDQSYALVRWSVGRSEFSLSLTHTHTHRHAEQVTFSNGIQLRHDTSVGLFCLVRVCVSDVFASFFFFFPQWVCLFVYFESYFVGSCRMSVQILSHSHARVCVCVCACMCVCACAVCMYVCVVRVSVCQRVCVFGKMLATVKINLHDEKEYLVVEPLLTEG